MNSKIIRIELTPVHVPFRELVRQTMESSEGTIGMALKTDESWLGGDFVICKLHTNDGYIGLGEAFVWLPETGVSPTQIIDIIQNALCNYVLEQDPFDIEKILIKMDNNVARSEVAKGLLDMACYDLMGQIRDLPARDFMGNQGVEEIPLAALVPLTDIKTMSTMARMFHKMGFKTIRYKLGNGMEEDVGISEALRSTLGPDVRLRVDYNQAYSPSEAIKAIKAIEQFNIDIAEQPVKANDFVGMAYVQKRVNVPLMCHEGFFSVQDFITLVELKAVGVLGINSERPGGVTNALKVLEYAKKKKIDAVLHNQPLGIASAMHIHLAAARQDYFGHATELFGYFMLEDDLLVDSIKYDKGVAKIPKGPGWGVKLNENALEKYATGPTVSIGNAVP